MNGIKSLADELREAMRNPAEAVQKPAEKKRPPPALPPSKVKPPAAGKPGGSELTDLFNLIKSHQPGQEKILIRLAPGTVRLLKQLKIAQSIEVNKFISFALHEYLKGNTALISYIKESTKNFDL